MDRNVLGYFTMVLHAHLPFVREPDHERFLEENWLYEALTGTYLPLLMGFEALIRDRVDFRVTMNLTPTLVSMLDDEMLRDRFEQRLRSLMELSEKEMRRQHHEAEFYELARFYRERFSDILDFYLHARSAPCRRGRAAPHSSARDPAAATGDRPLRHLRARRERHERGLA